MGFINDIFNLDVGGFVDDADGFIDPFTKLPGQGSDIIKVLTDYLPMIMIAGVGLGTLQLLKK